MAAPSLPDATVAITTRNRRDDLRAALQSAVRQQGCAIEILVVDDGSTDGTSEMVRAEFPHARVCRYEQSGGLTGRRNAAAPLASAPILVSIDDDAVFSSDTIVARTVADFDPPRIAAV